jgi:hypothetical protein
MSAAPHMEDYPGAVLTYATLCPRRPIKSRQIDSLPLHVKKTRQTDMDQRLWQVLILEDKMDCRGRWSSGMQKILTFLEELPKHLDSGRSAPAELSAGDLAIISNNMLEDLQTDHQIRKIFDVRLFSVAEKRPVPQLQKNQPVPQLRPQISLSLHFGATHRPCAPVWSLAPSSEWHPLLGVPTRRIQRRSRPLSE